MTSCVTSSRRSASTFPLTEWGQGFKDMSPALDTLEAELLNGRIAHGGHPVLSMAAANATTTRDPAGSRKLDKSRATGRIDPCKQWRWPSDSQPGRAN
ncbi:terminase TerL endonuclease subunit [Thauera humireducens]|uniref:terminase TerL endonuclease subunit n=1 Tax=Thauera humireducens TaxID=1134435 RepID=UPI00311D3F62